VEPVVDGKFIALPSSIYERLASVMAS